jgi:glucose-6-phosphate 1-dehydrogenase
MGKALDKSEVTIEVCFKASMSCITFPVSNEETLRDAYDKVFYDCLLGDQTIFPSTGEVIAQWRVTEEIAEKLQKIPLKIYKKGSKGEDIK